MLEMNVFVQQSDRPNRLKANDIFVAFIEWS